ncbi:NACHT, LRR and PYD domains-containing protein 3-like isoform X1 [Danio rerio]|uniref:NACHT, LRR and PYD domains-containing protein 3-like n=2 Tax=Danio rerio TaxID=7955 RepID=R4GEQ6_DANRE|nr:NACHT, LRR and PYD domains-containing protein 3-like [Danio rerio]|eukprot:XP_017206749.1 NACHT, LRR and PYD domains-containing protein 3-like [Danio rerio]
MKNAEDDTDYPDTSHGERRVQQKRSDSPVHSVLPMKRHKSMKTPDQLQNEDPLLNQSSEERSQSPEPSVLSMKSDKSMKIPIQLKDLDSPVDQSLMQKSHSLDPSVLSLKSDKSMKIPIQLKDGHSAVDQSLSQRSHLVDPSVLSLKSDKSMKIPIQLKDGHSPSDQSTLQESYSSDPSTVQFPVEQRHGQQTKVSEIQQALKSYMKTKHQYVLEGLEIQGNRKHLNEIYTELYIIEGETEAIINKHEFTMMERAVKSAAVVAKPINCRDIFRPLPGRDKAIRTVLTKGVAGIGKTVSVQKFILDWAEEKQNQDIQLIFPLPFREINLMKDKKFSLVSLLQTFFMKEISLHLIQNSSIIFIFDGLDECRLPLYFSSNDILRDVTKETSVDVLLTNLIVGNLLPSALIWITSRPAAAHLVPSECVHRVTEVRGFNDPQKEEYFSKRISDQSLANTIISHLKSSRSLYIMCHIPVFCWISATVLEKMLSEAETAEIPKTLTQMYTHFLMAQINIKDRKYHEINKDKEIILKLGKLAYEQLEKGNIIFYEEDLRECGIDVAEASVYSGLCTQIFREEFGLYLGKVFSFVHLSIQEHLAALYVHLSFHNSGENVLEAHEHRETMLSIHKYAFKKAIQSRNGHLDLFFRFLIGLSLETNHRLLEGLLVKKTESILEINKTVEYLRDEFKKQFCPNDCLLLLHCLHELNDHSMNDDIKACEKENMSPDYWRALFCILMTSNERSEEFRLQEYGRSDESLQWLHPVIKLHTKARLNDCNITDVGCTFLTTLLTSLSIVRELDLSHNNLQDSGVEILCVGVNRSAHGTALLKEIEKTRLNKVPAPSCGTHSLHKHENKETFHLHHKTDGLEPLKIKQTERKMHCKVSAPTCGSHSPHLLHLHHRTAGLQDGECSLKSLNLRVCGITEAGSDHLGKVLSLNPSHLKVLDLSWNTIGDPGVKHLCAALEKVDCALETLALAKCGLTEESCAALASALSSKSSSLTDLDMSVNDLQDSGVKKLCVGLQNPHCKLQKLRLANCKVTHEGVTALTEALKSSLSQLKELNLPENNLEESDLNMISMIIDK